MAKLLTEFIGTFFVVLTLGLTVLGATPLAPLAIGSALMVMVYMGGHISGGHYNPAVSLAVMLRGKLETGDMVRYWIAQLLGAIVAGLAVLAIVGETFAPAPGADAGMVGALLVEFLFTFALCLVVLQTATSDRTAGNSYYGLAIGFTLMVAAFAGGGISGGAINPALATGPILVNALFGGGGFGDLWLYWLAPLAGGALAAVVFKMQEAPGELETAGGD